MGDIRLQPVVVFTAGPLGNPPGCFPQSVEGIVSEVALGAACVLASEPHRLQLVEQVLTAAVDGEKAVGGFA